MTTFRRQFWRMAYPVCVVANKLLGVSYKWVNVGRGAWHPEYFDPLWHHRWYGDPIPKMPESVNLCGIRYKVTVAEGLVQFVNDDFGVSRLCFERDPYDRYGFLWYFDGQMQTAAPHIEQAYEWIKAVYGGSHNLKRPALAETQS